MTGKEVAKMLHDAVVVAFIDKSNSEIHLRGDFDHLICAASSILAEIAMQTNETLDRTLEAVNKVSKIGIAEYKRQRGFENGKET